MTATELARYIGQTGQMLIGFGSVTIPVTVKDVRRSYGRVDLLITPVLGSGEAWVDLYRVNLDGGPSC